ncbi:GNAT domain and Acyl-CoA N-acyltransferase domain-containing protein [Strongyloides ratti]|uniref:GNAT domain and Acyl-CoA N-acyltransferase domain-containing protein n=1 Tax=Strongyloides ratti TaxID=34506 RepID=A0A090LTV0_STRRB|nr:GNAT domain and Acyl-CoA N-acyltransferase domain-containing protein [Strongyloides ratti]CEF71074.1 GNAT domain and Acyl-CoA N-acyltransferase domain-containing protein [Strongyloides ratti]
MTMNIIFRKPNDNDIDKINHFIADIFNKVEPVNQGIGLCGNCMLNWASSPPISIGKLSIDSNLSLLAEHEGQLIGARLISISDRPQKIDNDVSINFEYCDKCKKKGEDFDRFLKMLYKLKNQVWDLVPSDVTKLAHREISAVKKEYQRKGIGRQLAEKEFSDEYLRSLGIHGIVSETSSIANQHLLKSIGFKPLAEEKYSDYDIHPADGGQSLVLNFKKI